MQPGVQSDCSGGSLDHKHETEISLEGGNAQIQDAGQVKSKPKGRYRVVDMRQKHLVRTVAIACCFSDYLIALRMA